MKTFKTPIDDLLEESQRLSLDATPTEEMPELVQQTGKKEADINVIVKRFLSNGHLPVLNLEPLYADFSQAGDFTMAQQMLLAAQQAFEQVPAEVRQKFNNNTAAFIAWAETDEGKEALRTEFGRNPDPKVPDTPPDNSTAPKGPQEGVPATPPAPPSK